MLILFGPGIFCLAEMERLPETGDKLNFSKCGMREGVYEVVQQGMKNWNGVEYPYFTRRRVADLPVNVQAIPLAMMNC